MQKNTKDMHLFIKKCVTLHRLNGNRLKENDVRELRWNAGTVPAAVVLNPCDTP